jgi:hypothetical protein
MADEDNVLEAIDEYYDNMDGMADEDNVLEAIDEYYDNMDGRTREDALRGLARIEEKCKEVRAELLS